MLYNKLIKFLFHGVIIISSFKLVKNNLIWSPTIEHKSKYNDSISSL